MLHLEAGVHLEEIEVALLIDDELDGAGGMVAHRVGEAHRLGTHGRPRLLVEEGGRGLLDHLLVPALDRAFALAEMHEMPLPVAEDLDLDVPGLLDELLEEHPFVAEGGGGLGLRPREPLLELGVVAGDAHALAATAGRGLDHHRIADAPGDVERFAEAADGVGMAGHDADARPFGEALALDLVAHRADGVGRRADEHDPRLLERLREEGVLGEKAVARVDRPGAGAVAGFEDAVDHQIAVARRRRADADGLVRHLHMEGTGVGLGVDGHGGDAVGAAGTDNAAGDLAAVGDQDLLEHRVRQFGRCQAMADAYQQRRGTASPPRRGVLSRPPAWRRTGPRWPARR